MQPEPNCTDHHKKRSEFIRNLVQKSRAQQVTDNKTLDVPKTIVQFWHDPGQLPEDVRECISTWSRWKTSGFAHRVFDTADAGQFISHSLGPNYARAFARCYHPAMQADYFRLCYLFVKGGMYVDADDVCIVTDIASLFEGRRFKVQPLCYDITSDTMVPPTDFLQPGVSVESWIFYFNNNPLIACQGDPFVKRALERATQLLRMR